MCVYVCVRVRVGVSECVSELVRVVSSRLYRIDGRSGERCGGVIAKRTAGPPIIIIRHDDSSLVTTSELFAAGQTSQGRTQRKYKYRPPLLLLWRPQPHDNAARSPERAHY